MSPWLSMFFIHLIRTFRHKFCVIFKYFRHFYVKTKTKYVRRSILQFAPCEEIQEAFGFRIPLPGFRIPLPGFRIPLLRFWIPLLGFRIPLLDSGFHFLDSRFHYWIPVPGFRIPLPGFRIPLPGI